MPYAPLAPCPRSGCPEMRAPGHLYCRSHEAEQGRAYAARRGTTAQRGYGTAWQKLRKLILHRDPVCRLCGSAPASEVDHVLSLRAGGENSEDNLQGLCKPCHSAKTTREDGRWGPRR
jgi:5-methylcytosine-specific restriction protein A